MGIETSFGAFAEEAATRAEGAARDIAYWKGVAQAGGISESNNDWKAAYESLLADNEEARKRCNALRDQITDMQREIDGLRAELKLERLLAARRARNSEVA